MYKVVVVDDEPSFIHSITRMIKNYHPEFEVVGFSYNGKDALEKLAAEEVDLLITDIKMPMMDGIELLKVVYDKYPQIQTVIVSGYQDFEYAKAAFKTGITDYLLKPIEKEQFLEVMNKISEKLEKRYDAIEYTMMVDIINGDYVEDKLIQKYFEFTSFKLLLVLQGAYINPTNNIFYFSDSPLKKLIEENIDEIQGTAKKWIIEIIAGKQYLVIFVLNDQQQCDDNFCNFYDKMKLEIQDINFAFTQTPIKVSDLKRFADRLDKNLKNNVSIGQPGIFPFSESNSSNVSGLGYLDGTTVLKIEVIGQSKSYELMIKEIKKLQEIWGKEKSPQIVVERIVRQILYLLQRRSSIDLKNDLEQEFYDLLPAVKSYGDVTDILINIIGDLFNKTEKTDTIGEEIMVKADQYIKYNMDKMITLQNTCYCLHISQPYLSRIIRIYKSMSFNEYVTNLRIQNAKEIFEQSSEMLIKDVANIVGYEDQHYFSKVFKLVTGYSPSEYKFKVSQRK